MEFNEIYTKRSNGIKYKIIYEGDKEYCLFRVKGMGFINVDKNLIDQEFELSLIKNTNIIG